jgi:hypothetical protein
VGESRVMSHRKTNATAPSRLHLSFRLSGEQKAQSCDKACSQQLTHWESRPDANVPTQSTPEVGPFGDSMENWFSVDHLDVERLLGDWRWLCPQRMALVAKNAFADLFLRDESGEIFRLDLAVGKLTRVADSEPQFRELAASREKRKEWFKEAAEQVASEQGLKRNATQYRV